MLEKIQETAAYLKEKMHTSPETAIILGTGLGSLANEIMALLRCVAAFGRRCGRT